jgi:hypothetical protein
MLVSIIKEIDSYINGYKYTIGQVIDVDELNAFSESYYIRYIKDTEDTIDWIPKDSVKLISKKAK